MMVQCDLNCSKRGVCKVYDIIQQYKGRIDISVFRCQYHDSYAVQEPPRDVMSLHNRSQEIRQHMSKSNNDAPGTANSLRGTGMKLEVDDETIT